MLRKYGRNSPPHLPAHRMLSRLTPNLPPTADLRPWCGAVKDQGSEGSCTAHAGSSALELIFRKYLKASPTLSPQYLYAQELIRQGNFPSDDGSDGVTLCETLIVDGVCRIEDYPYVAGEILQPTIAQNIAAKAYRMGAYHGLSNAATALSVLGDVTPWPVEIGFTVYGSFEGAALASTGVMPIPNSSEKTLGGHEVLMVGYDIGTPPTLRPLGTPPSALIQNSWGTGWGLSGFFWMPLQILDLSDTDLKIAHIGHPWGVS